MERILPEYSYEPIDLEDEIFLVDIPIEVIQSSIRTQFDEPLEYRKKDYIQSFFTSYDIQKDNTVDEDLPTLELSRDRFMLFIEDIFEEYLNVGFNDLDNFSEEEQNDIIHHTYRFFIKNIKKNFVNIVLNYINEYRNDIEELFEKRKDVTFNNFKVEIEDEYDITVLSNLGDIINHIFNELKDGDIDDFFNLCEYDETIIDLDCIREYYDELIVTGNFIEKYIDMLDDEFITEIQSKVRNKILKKYPKRNRKIEDIKAEAIELDEAAALESEEETNEEK